MPSSELTSLINASQRSSGSGAAGRSSGAAAQGSDRAASSSETRLGGMDTFLELFITQLENQRPTKPQDSRKLVEQLATFSTVEQMQSTNEKVGRILEDLAQGQIRDSLGFIGQRVSGPGNSIGLQNGSAEIDYSLSSDAAEAQIAVKRPGGETVATLDAETEQGAHTATWDGKSDDGQQLEDGRYIVEITAQKEDGSEVATSTTTSGVVDSVTLENDQAMLQLANGGRLNPNEVREVAPAASDSGASPSESASSG
jgi:flagellar basal-body rod modification protein FlgD